MAYTKNISIPPLQLSEALASLGLHTLYRAGCVFPTTAWAEHWDGEAQHLLNIAEFCHREGAITKEQYETIQKNLIPF